MKTVIREIIAMLIILLAVILVIVMFFFDYIKSGSNTPQAAVYQMTEDEEAIMKEKDEYTDSQNKIVLSSGYTVTAEELSQYKASGELKTGQTNPFDETPMTDVLYDAEGNAYYKTVTSKNDTTTNSSSTTNWYGTVSGTTGGTSATTNTNTASSTGAVITNSNQTSTITNQNQTTVGTKQVTTVPESAIGNQSQTQVYNPATDITAPSTDSGNLSQSTGKK